MNRERLSIFQTVRFKIDLAALSDMLPHSNDMQERERVREREREKLWVRERECVC